MIFADTVDFDWAKSGPMWAIVALVIVSTLASISAVMYFFIRNASASRQASEERLAGTQTASEKAMAAAQTASEANMKDLVNTMKEHVATVTANALKESEECRKERRETTAMFVQTLREERESYKRSLSELQTTFVNKLDTIAFVRKPSLPKIPPQV